MSILQRFIVKILGRHTLLSENTKWDLAYLIEQASEQNASLRTQPAPITITPQTPPEFTRELRYLVVKIKDANKYLTPTERDILERLTSKCALGRIDDGKPRLECVVIESDWPEYEPTWEAIEARMSQPTAPEGAPPLDAERKFATEQLAAMTQPDAATKAIKHTIQEVVCAKMKAIRTAEIESAGTAPAPVGVVAFAVTQDDLTDRLGQFNIRETVDEAVDVARMYELVKPVLVIDLSDEVRVVECMAHVLAAQHGEEICNGWRYDARAVLAALKGETKK